MLVAGLFASVLPGGSQQASAATSLHFLYGSGSQTGGKQITLRVELADKAPSGGAKVTLASSNAAVLTPASVTVAAGQTTREFKVNTAAVTANTNVTVSASYLGVTKSRVVLIKAPVLSSIGVQTKIRAGGFGKVIVRLSGPAPAGGTTVSLMSNPTAALTFPSPVVVPAGQYRLALAVPAMSTLVDVPAVVTASLGSVTLSKNTIIRNYDVAVPTPTPTETLEPTATATQHPLAVDVTTELWNGPGPFATNNFALFRVCVFAPIGLAGSVDVTAANGATPDPAQISWLALSVPSFQCEFVSLRMTSAGDTNLILTANAVGYPPKIFTSETVTFFVPATATPTNTPEPTATATNTPEPTATATNTPIPPISGDFEIDVLSGSGPYYVGDTAQLRVCHFGAPIGIVNLSAIATNGVVSPPFLTLDATVGLGYRCTTVQFDLTSTVSGTASITVTATLAGYEPVTITSPDVQFLPLV